MKLIVVAESAEVAVSGADLVCDYVAKTTSPVLGVATGGSVVGLYRELAQRHARKEISFGATRAFLLDEYVGLGADHPQSYRQFIRDHLSTQLDLHDDCVFGLNGTTADFDAEALHYERLLDKHRVGLQIVGIGRNGHLAFNEPGSSLASRTRVLPLSAQTRRDNARFFDRSENVPSFVLTQGIGTILQAARIVLVASGAHKSTALARALEGPVGSRVPASALQLHADVVVVADAEAASELTIGDLPFEAVPAGRPFVTTR